MCNGWSYSLTPCSGVMEQLDVDIVPYIVLLVVPVLGRMSDPCDSVRFMATQCFATLIRLLPLEVRDQSISVLPVWVAVFTIFLLFPFRLEFQTLHLCLKIWFGRRPESDISLNSCWMEGNWRIIRFLFPSKQSCGSTSRCVERFMEMFFSLPEVSISCLIILKLFLFSRRTVWTG